MSADNWTTCPKCHDVWTQQLSEKGAAVERAYGTVSAEEYERLRADLRTFAGRRQDSDLREDYELGMNPDGTFTVDYGCHCQTCGFSYSFKRTEKAPISA